MKTGRKKATDGENGQPNTLDIPHEEIDQRNDQSLTPVIETVDDQIRHEIAKFNFSESAIAQLKQKYGSLVITGPTDKVGYEAVKKAWNEVRSKRTGLEKKGVELRGNFNLITKAIKTEEVRLIELLDPLETELLAKWKAIDDEKERVKREQEEAEGRRLMTRIQELQQIGMVLKDGFYQIGETITVDVASLRALSDDTFETLKGAAASKAAEIKKAQEAEKERKRLEQLELQRQQDELKRQQEEMAEQQRQLQEQKAEMARQLRDLRLGKLQGIGLELSHNGDIVYFESIRLHLVPLIDMTADEFNRTLDITAGQIKELKNQKAQAEESARQEKIKREQREKHIADVLETAGLKYVWAERLFRYKDDEVTIERTFGDLLALSDAEIAATANELGARVSEAMLQQDHRDKLKLENQQKAEKLAMNDKQRWAREIEQMNAQALRILPGDYKTEKYKKKAQTFLDRLTNLINEFKPE